MRSLAALLMLAACGGGGGFPDARPIDASIPGGTFSLSWTLTDTAGKPITCDQIGAQSVTVVMHNRSVDGGTTEVFACSTGMGTSEKFLPGTYDMMFELDGPNSSVIATAADQHGVELVSGQNTELTPLTFAVNATGGLVLHLASGKAGGNCGPTATGGAGITTTSITLVHNSDSSCAPLTLMVGTVPYTIDCTMPVDGPCIEATTDVTAMGVASDSYTIHIKGKVGATVCWTNDDSLPVPPNGNTLTRTLNLAYAMGTPGC